MIRTTEESHKRKAKGESLQMYVCDFLRSLPIVDNPSMIKSQKMSCHGEDIILEEQIREDLPVSIECKTSATGFARTYATMDQAIRQAEALASSKPITPIGVIKQDGHEPLAVVRFEDLINVFLPSQSNPQEDDHEIH